MTSNAFVTPLAATAQVIARTFWNNSLRATTENFYGPAEPGPSNYILEGDETQIPNGVLYRSSITGALYIVDSTIQKGNPVHGGNYTRAGIAYRLEDTLASADFSTYEIGEALLTVGQSVANTRLYVKASNSNEIVDIGLPVASSITTAMLQTDVVTNVEIATNTIINENIEDSTITNTKLQNVGVADGDLVEMDSTGYPAADGSQITNLGVGVPKGYINGLILSNNTTDAAKDIDILAGICRGGSNSADIELSSTYIKQIDAAWAVGTNQGGLDTGSVVADTWYHIWAIRRTDTEVSDILFSTSATSPTMPTNYNQKRRIGAVLTDGSANIIAFYQIGDRFFLKTRINNLSTNSPSGSAANLVVSTPLGVELLAILALYLKNSSEGYVVVNSPDDADVAPSETNHDVTTGSAVNMRGNNEILRKTNESSQVRYRSSDTSVTVLRITTVGWIDPRGRNI